MGPTTDPLPGFKDVKPMVFAGIFPTDSADYPQLRDAMEKLHMNDAAFSFEPDSSEALGFGFRCGFLGLLHMEIIQERLEREFNLDLITTAPSVVYNVYKTDGTMVRVENPAKLPARSGHRPHRGAHRQDGDPRAGGARRRRPRALPGEARRAEGHAVRVADRVIVTYELPFAEVLFDFHDKLKSISRGYASMDYELIGYQAGQPREGRHPRERRAARRALHHRPQGEELPARAGLAEKLKEFVPQQQYEVAIQAAIGGKIIARETVKALRKDVTAKCYGGDISRKRKLLEKQKEGKKRMKQVGTSRSRSRRSSRSSRSTTSTRPISRCRRPSRRGSPARTPNDEHTIDSGDHRAAQGADRDGRGGRPEGAAGASAAKNELAATMQSQLQATRGQLDKTQQNLAQTQTSSSRPPRRPRSRRSSSPTSRRSSRTRATPSPRSPP
jgi:hypothetical protein